MFGSIIPTTLVDTLINEIKSCEHALTPFTNRVITYCEKQYTLFDILYKKLRGSVFLISDAKRFVDELTPIAQNVILNSLNIDANAHDSWNIFNKALSLSGMSCFIQNNSKFIYEGRKMEKDWKIYALSRLDLIYPLIRQREIDSHAVTILPYTDAPTKNIKLLHGKDILIFFKLIKSTYPNIKINTSMCFKFDDIEISMRCLDTIKKENEDAYLFIITTIFDGNAENTGN